MRDQENIETLIDSIEEYYYRFKPPLFILFYIPSRHDIEDKSDATYFAALAIKQMPTEDILMTILHESREEIGNIIFGAEFDIVTKDEAIDLLESLLA
jgi:hypothetical protein